MLLTLVKKDFLIIKKYILFMIVISIYVPIYISSVTSFFQGLVAFLSSALYAGLLMYQQISVIDLKYPKASNFLCTTPYPRNFIVMSKYLFFIVIFIICLIFYNVTSFVFPKVIPISFLTIILALLVYSIIFSIYTPFQYKFGFEKTKHCFMIILFSFTLGTVIIEKATFLLTPFKIVSNIFATFPEIIKCILLFLTSALILVISVYVSIKIYSKKDF